MGGARGLVRVDEWVDECRIGGNTGAAGNAGWMRFATRGMRRALVHVPMMVPAMTVPFLSSMVTDSWLSFWRNLTSFISRFLYLRPCGTLCPLCRITPSDLPARRCACGRGGARRVDERSVRVREVSFACGLARDAARVCVSRAFSGSRLKLVGFSQSHPSAHWLAPTTHRHSQVTAVFRLLPPRKHNEEHEGTRGGSVRASGASRVEP